MPPRSNNNNNKSNNKGARIRSQEGAGVRAGSCTVTTLPARPSVSPREVVRREKKEAKNKKQTKSKRDRDRQVKE
jgi:hypothetical protein